jgi:uncharacterized membrane protein YdbT with pleckstrin-like domain
LLPGSGLGHHAGVNEETSVWKGSPSQWLNIWHYAWAAVLAFGVAAAGGLFFPPAWLLLLLPLAWAAWRFFVVRCQRYELTTERLRITTGVLNQHIDEVELYRVKDILMTRPLWMRLTGLASLHLQTSDRSLPVLNIPAIRDGLELREQLRAQVEQIRDRKRVREMDFDETAGGLDDVAPPAG